jgi:CHAD domain-containing protein
MVEPGRPESDAKGTDDFGLAASQILSLRVDEIVGLSRGLLDVTDPEPVEQMWLALRRLRAALEVFRPCFSKAQYRNGREEVRQLVRPVGARRDVDNVITAFQVISAEMGHTESSGMRQVIDRLRQDQAETNRRLAQAIHGRRLQSFSFRIEELAEAAFDSELDPEGREYSPVETIPPKTDRLVGRRLARLRAAAPGALEPDATGDQHRMRVAAERLRYALELTGEALGTQAHTARRAARALQEILTEIRDCDLATPAAREQIADMEKEDIATILERARGSRDLDPVLVQAAPHRASYRGLELALIHLAARRQMLFDRLKRLWQEQSRQGVWVALETSLSS